MRLLLAARLSQTSDGQTGIESQDALTRRWAEANGHVIVAVAADHKSGTSAPWDRPNLRPWVTDEARLAQYDGVVAYRLDRLSRGDNASTNSIEKWAHDHGKRLLTEDGLTFPCEGAEGIRWDVTKRIAHEEWLKASERYKRMQSTLRTGGFWVGQAPYGYCLIPDGEHKRLAPDEATAPVVKEIFAAVLDGRSMAEIARWLDAQGIPSHRGGEWEPKVISQVVNNSTYAGQPAGANRAIGECPAIIDAGTWQAVQAVLRRKSNRKGKANSRTTAYLTGLLRCGMCGGPMYLAGGGQFMRCHGTAKAPSKCAFMVSRSALEAAADELVADMCADHEGALRLTAMVPASSQAEAIGRIDLALALLLPRLQDGDIKADAYLSETQRLMAERQRLADEGDTAEHEVVISDGRELAEHWQALTIEARRANLITGGYVFRAGKAADGWTLELADRHDLIMATREADGRVLEGGGWLPASD